MRHRWEVWGLGDLLLSFTIWLNTHAAVTDRSYHPHPVHLLDEEMETGSC